MAQNNTFNIGTLGRLVSGISVCIAGIIATSPQPTRLLWQASVVLSEWGHWLALLSLLLIPGYRRSRLDALGSILAAIAILLLLVPLWNAVTLSRTLPISLEKTFGSSISQSIPNKPPRPAALVFKDLLAGISSSDVLVDEHVYQVVDNKQLRLDLYRPAFADGTLPVVIVVHAGGWTSGNKRQLTSLNDYLASRGYVVASIEYRLAPQWQFPAAQEDLTAAIKYIKTLEYSHGLDPNRIALIGRSAGGQIALLSAYTNKDPSIRGVVSFYAPIALRWGYNNPAKLGVIDSSGILELYLGGTPESHSSQYFAAEPAQFVNDSTPPTLLIQGLRDEHVAPFHSNFLSARLLEEGVPHFILRMPWATHGCDYFFSGPCGQISTFAVERFLGSVFKKIDGSSS